MADKTNIEWTDATWNPIRARNRETGKLGWHCTHASEGCRFCYAERINVKPGATGGTGFPYKPGHEKDIEIFLDENTLTKPLHWRKARKIFVCSMTDLFADFVKDEWIDRMLAVMALCPQHTFQVLTKRPERMRAYMLETWQGTPAQRLEFPDLEPLDMPAGCPTGRMSQVEEACEPLLQKFGLVDTSKDRLWTADGKCKAMEWEWPLPNVWLGTSCEDQATADERIPHLLHTPAAIRFLSCEPMLGSIDLANIAAPDPTIHGTDVLTPFNEILRPQINWVVCGGESGPRARPMHPDWARSLRDQCTAAGVAFFFKQWGEWSPYGGTEDRAQTTFVDPVTGDEIAEHDCAARDGDLMFRLGKKRAGRLLDGVEHNGIPA